MLYSPKGDSGSAGGTRRVERILTEVWKSAEPGWSQCFYRYSIESGRGPRFQLHLEFERRTLVPLDIFQVFTFSGRVENL